MEIIFGAFVAYAFCFWLMNKTPARLILSEGYQESGEKAEGGVRKFFDELLTCSFCTGFHCGYVTYFLFWLSAGATPLSWEHAVQAFLAGMASAAWCYFLDTAIAKMEG